MPHFIGQELESNAQRTLNGTFRDPAEPKLKIGFAYRIFSSSKHPYCDFEKTQPLQTAASLGLIAFAKELLENDANVNAQGGKYGNALQSAAAQNGNETVSVVRLLIEKGAKFSAVNAPQAAAENAHEIIGGRKYGNVLQAATVARNEAVGGEYGNAFQAAAAPPSFKPSSKDKEAVVRLLIEKSADVNAQVRAAYTAMRSWRQYGTT
ncbi:hypothetical protein FN846DRAFT_996395 [Sphaerosporella brunnea]|uniref:Uncharacterized protein n=1 Tax=Sphaerosporella brunnea TaxID=1250544 RepID=A0A5J5EIR3_9PEZI|nr:hypothetical protein FN846DRAFT_996395 [Sphaerosporella brunnea]